jgi:uncharacterized protein YqjF (DUF2071 family)
MVLEAFAADNESPGTHEACRRMMPSYPDRPEDQVIRPVLIQRWDTLTFLHWRYSADLVQSILPPGLEVDTFEGDAWVGLVPFRMVRVRPPGVPVPPWITTFPETNVRTYVRGPDGGVGVWFASLEITRLLGVVVARTAFRVPYTWARMEMIEHSAEVTYRSSRRWPGPTGIGCDVAVRPGGPAEHSPTVDFLVNRWRAYTTNRSGQVIFSPVAHAPWTLYDAGIAALSDSLVEAAGLPAPTGAPLVHYSPGVSARIGLPRIAARSRH